MKKSKKVFCGRLTQHLAVTCSCLILAGCRTTDSPTIQQTRVEKQNQAGAVLTSVTRATPWDELVDDLKVEFEMTPALALQKSIPLTQRERLEIVDSVAGAAKVQFPGANFSESTTIKELPGQPSTTEKTSSRSLSSSDRDALVPKNGVDLADKLKAFEPLTGAIETNPRLEYRDAYALYQTIKLLNRSIQDAPEWAGMKPYVVTLQISLLGYARHMPYDAYSTVSFFSGRELGSPIPLMVKGVANDPSLLRNPIIVPLLISDNLETSMQERSANRLRQLSLTLSAMVQAVGAGANFNSYQQKLNAILGQDFNSLITDGRLTANTVMVRLGAMNEGTGKYSVVPQKYEMTFLLLVPEEALSEKRGEERGFMRYVAKTTFRDATDGVPLPEWDQKDILHAAAELEKRHLAKTEYLQNGTNVTKVFGELLRYVQFNQFTNFATKLMGDGITNKQEALWLELGLLYSQSAYSQSPFQLKPAKEASYPPTNQVAFIQTDKKGWTVNLLGGRNLKPAAMAADFVLDNRGSANRVLPASSVSIGSDRTSLILKFPSIPAELAVSNGFHVVRLKAPNSTNDYIGVFRSQKDIPPSVAEVRKVSISTPLSSITADKDGRGELQLFVSDNEKSAEDQPFFIQVQGASFDISPRQAVPSLAWDGEVFRVIKGSEIRLQLSNLTGVDGLLINLYDKSWADDRTKAKPVVTRSLTVKTDTTNTKK